MMSAMTPKASSEWTWPDFRFVPGTDIVANRIGSERSAAHLHVCADLFEIDPLALLFHAAGLALRIGRGGRS